MMLSAHPNLARWAVVLFIASASAQTCYYPDGSASTDVSCSSSTGPSFCCPADSFCLSSGLCFTDGIVTRSSCTDQSWKSEQCPTYCAGDTPQSSVPLTPCSTNATANTFVCGLNVTDCTNAFAVTGSDSLVLRAAQVAALLQPALAQQSNAACSASGSGAAAPIFTLAQVAALACGLAIPLLAGRLTALYFLRRERRKAPQLMYDLPDECKEGFVSSPSQAHTPRSESVPRFSATLRSHGSSKGFSDMGSASTPINKSSFVSPMDASAMARSFHRAAAAHHNTFELDSSERPIELAHDSTTSTTSVRSARSAQTRRSSRHELGSYR